MINEAAERLRRRHPATADVELLDDALATERQRTVERISPAVERYRRAYLMRHSSNDGECEHGFGPPATRCPNTPCDEKELQEAWQAILDSIASDENGGTP